MIAHPQRLFSAREWRRWLPRLLAGSVGLVLLVAGFLKATDMMYFIRQLKGYGIISHPYLLVMSAWGLIALQCALGAGLLVFYRPKLMLTLSTVLWLTLLAGTVWAWITGATQDCGCYGPWLKQTPREATRENGILLAITFVTRMIYAQSGVRQARYKAWTVGIASLIGLGLPMIFGFPISGVVHTNSKDLSSELGELQTRGLKPMDLSRGTHLIVLIGTECLHCQEAVPELDMLAEEEDLPPLVALSPNDEQERRAFLEEFHPLFPVGQISEEAFLRLLGDGELPRIILLHDGHAREVWDQTVPDMERLKELLPGRPVL